MSKENTAVFIGHNECYGVTSEQIKEAKKVLRQDAF